MLYLGVLSIHRREHKKPTDHWSLDPYLFRYISRVDISDSSLKISTDYADTLRKEATWFIRNQTGKLL